jgi:hypothetical protein
VWNTDGSTGGLGNVSLESFGSYASPLQVSTVDSPRYDKATYAMPEAHRATLTLDAPDTARSSSTQDVSATFGVPAGAPPASSVRFGLRVPSGWTVTPTSPTVVGRVAGGASATATGRVTAADGDLPVASLLTATADYEQRDESQDLSDTRTVRALPSPPINGRSATRQGQPASSGDARTPGRSSAQKRAARERRGPARRRGPAPRRCPRPPRLR